MTKMIKKFLLIGMILMSLTAYSYANGVVLINGEVVNQDTNQDFAFIQFDASWKNSWNDGVNKDALWVFAKYSVDEGETWNHATLALSGTNPNGFSSGTGTGIDMVVPNDLKGVFIQRSYSGVGDVSTTGIQIVWDYGIDGLSDQDVYGKLILKLFGIEMVYVPSGSFYAGDGASSAYSFKQGSSDADPWFINSDNAINVDNSASNGFYYVSSGYAGEDATGSSFTISSGFPKGYSSFYVMKYEVSEAEWVSFFNTLTTTQKTNRDITGANGKNTDAAFKRNTVSWTAGDATTDRGDRACGYLSWMDGAAFADWAGLRPVTELEYEKSARGTQSVVSGEYAWGSTSLTSGTSISGSEDGSETISTSGANAIYNNITFSGGDGGSGPVRTGIFAKSTTGRTQSGSGYFGSMELSGNLSERVVTVGNAAGRLFTGTHGDGEITSNGFADNSDWPGYDGTQVTAADGSGIRGGSWSDSSSKLQISDRQEAAQNLSSRQSRFGFRAARTAP